MPLMSKELKQEIENIAHSLKADGCSSSPEFSWHICCDEHDIAYRTGKDLDGKPITKFQADVKLMQCIKENAVTWIGRHIISRIYFLGVTIGGFFAWIKPKTHHPKDHK